LYRKWRPNNFEQVFGQTHVLRILRNAVKAGDPAHAYLFAGPRGVGKTSVARILARALNCTDLKEGDSCGVCITCMSFAENRNMDLIEIDAASNRGIDEVRELIDKIKFAPTQSKYKVFIIDEAHMLTKEAWNALLKTLEEPPANTVFVLVTTEAHKVPVTINSRCQILHFTKINEQDMLRRLKQIAKSESIEIEDEAVLEISRSVSGGMRDAESLLDQIRAFVGNTIKASDVRTLLGASDARTVQVFFENLYEGKVREVFLNVESLLQEGVDLEKFIDDAVLFSRSLLKIKVGLSKEMAQSLGEEYVEQLESKADNYQPSRLMKIISELIEAKRNLKNADIIELPLEMAALNLTPIQDTAVTSESKDQSVSNSKAGSAPRITTKPESPKASVDVASPATQPEKNIGTTLEAIEGEWPEFIKSLKAYNHSIFSIVKSMSLVGLKDNRVVLETEFDFYKDRLSQANVKTLLHKALEDSYKVPLGYKVQTITKGRHKQSDKPAESKESLSNSSDEQFVSEVEEIFQEV
jgi:DNA polymerase-3 subunit gamma/tau